MNTLPADLRYAWRSLTRAPLFTIIAVASIALGVGANTAVFTLLDQVTLRRLPIERPAELAQVSPAPDAESYGGNYGDGSELSWPMYLDLRDHNDVFSGMCALFPTTLHVGYRDQNERVNGELVSGTYFGVLGVRAALGRLFTQADDRAPGAHPVAVLAYDYWQGRFAGDPAIVGRTILINGHQLTVVGVAAAGFHGIDLGRPARMFVPMMMQPQMGPLWLELTNRRFTWVQVYGRLRPGISRERAATALQPYYSSLLEMEVKDAAFARASAETRRKFAASKLVVTDASRGRSELRDSVTRPLNILMAAAVGVLLIACANLANLLLARGASRQREIALRLALGAGRRRVVRLLLVEALVLATIGGVAGSLVAVWGAGLLLGFFTTPEAPLAVAASLDARTLAFMIAVALGTALLAGLTPALSATRLALAPALKGAGGGVVREQPRLRKTLVVVQVALSFLMLAAAGLFLRSLDNLMRAGPGFAAERVVTFSVDLERSGYGSEKSRQFARDLLARAQSTRGVMAAGFSTIGLLEGSYWGMEFTVEGFEPKPGEGAGSLMNAVSPGFFTALRVPIVMGRDFTERDQRIQPADEKQQPWRTAIINEAFAREYFAGRNPIGRHVGVGDDLGTPMPIEVIGVAKDTRYGAVREEARPQLFVPAFEARGINNLTLYVRSDAPATAMLGSLRRIVADLDPAVTLYHVGTVDDLVSRSMTNERVIASLSTGFGVLATLLAIVGLYGVMTWLVTQRTREIGIRMALGALASTVAWRVLREAALLVVAGLALAAPTAWWLGRYVQSQLYEVRPGDVATLASAAVLLVVVSALAVLVPARRAAQVDPMSALRQD